VPGKKLHIASLVAKEKKRVRTREVFGIHKTKRKESTTIYKRAGTTNRTGGRTWDQTIVWKERKKKGTSEEEEKDQSRKNPTPQTKTCGHQLLGEKTKVLERQEKRVGVKDK